MTELRLSIPPSVLQQMAALATEITIIEDGLAQAHTLVERTRFQTSTELTNYLSRKLDKHFYTTLSQRVGFQQAMFLSASKSTRETADKSFADWKSVIDNFKRGVKKIPSLQAEIERFTSTTEHGLREDLKSIKASNQSLVNREKEAHNIFTEQLTTLQQELLQTIKPVGSLRSTIDATRDELRHIEYQQRLRFQATEDKLSSLQSALDTGSFQAIRRERVFRQAESDVLERVNPLLFHHMSEENNTSKEQLRNLHATIPAQLSTLREWENKLNAMASIFTSDHYTTVKKPLERSIASMRTAIVAQQEQVVQNLRSIRDDLNNAYLEHKRGAELIRTVKAEMDALKQKWHQSIDLLKKKYMLNELEELRRIYEKEIPEQSRSKAFELCAEAETTLASTEQAIKMWSELMDQRVSSEDAKMKEMEQVLNRLLSELVLTTHTRSMGIDELNRRLSHKAFELTQLVSSRMDETQFKQKLAGKVSKSDTDIAFGVYCPAEHEEQVVPQPPRGKATKKRWSEKDIAEDGRLLREYQEQCASRKESFSFIKYFTTAIMAERSGLVDDNSLLNTESAICEGTNNSTALDSDPIATHILQVSPSLVQQRVAASLALREASQKSVSSPLPPSVPSALPSSIKDQIRLRPGIEAPFPKEKMASSVSLTNIYMTESANASPIESTAQAHRLNTGRGTFRGRRSYAARVAQNILNANEDLSKLTNSIAKAERDLEEAETKRVLNADLTGIRARTRANSEGTSSRHQQLISVPSTVHGRSRSGKVISTSTEAFLLCENDKFLISTNNDVNTEVMSYSKSESKDKYRPQKYPDGINPRTGLFEEISPFEYQQPRSKHSTVTKSTPSLPTMPEGLVVVSNTLGRDQNRQRQQLNARRAVHSAVPAGEQYILNPHESVPTTSIDDIYVKSTGASKENDLASAETNKSVRAYSANAALKVSRDPAANPLLTNESDKLGAFLLMGNPGKESLPKVLGGIMGTPVRPSSRHRRSSERSWEEKALRRLSHAKIGDPSTRSTIDRTEKVLQEAEKAVCQN